MLNDDSSKDPIEEEGNVIFQEEFSRLSSTERRIIVAMAKGKERTRGNSQRSRGRNQRSHNLPERTIGKEVVEKMKRGKYIIKDRLFERWICTAAVEKSLNEKVLDALTKPTTLQKLYELLPEHSKPAIRGTVYRLIRRGMIKRVGKGKYVKG